MVVKTVFMCIPTLASAGAERFVTELACNLDRKLYNPIVVITNRLDRNSYFYSKLIRHGIEVVDVSNKNYFIEICNAVSVLKKYKPDIVHTNVGAVLHMLIPMALSGKSIPHLFTTHSMGYRLFAGIKKKIIRFCFKHRIVIPVAICDTVRQSIIDEFKLPIKDVEMVYNGVDTREFTPNSPHNSQVVFINVGTLYKIKNQSLLINAFSILHKKHPETKLRFVGDGELREQLFNEVVENGIQDSVVFEGNQKNVADFLHKADVYCCSSEVEGLPISVLEAMACGLPVITTPAGGVVDIVKDDFNGYVVDDNVQNYAAKMEMLLDSNIRKYMSANSRVMAEKLDVLKCCRQYEDLYRRYSSI